MPQRQKGKKEEWTVYLVTPGPEEKKGGASIFKCDGNFGLRI